jgi:hypothetical protein
MKGDYGANRVDVSDSTFEMVGKPHVHRHAVTLRFLVAPLVNQLTLPAGHIGPIHSAHN